jgi:hypothetical protein
MKNEKEMFIKNTDVKVEEGHIIVVDDTVYKVSYSNIPELVKKGIIVFKDVQNMEYDPHNLFPTEYDWWYTNALSEYDFMDCHEEAIGQVFDGFPGAELSFIIKYISSQLNTERLKRDKCTSCKLSDGYYFINTFNGEPVFSTNVNVDFSKFAWFHNEEDAKFAAEVIKHFYE